MLDKDDLQLIVDQLPPDYKNKLAKMTDLSRTTVWKFFKGEEMKPASFEKIYDAALVLVEEYHLKLENRTKVIKALRAYNRQQKLFN